MSRAREETKFLLTYRFRAYPSALLEYKMENWFHILCTLYNHALEERKRAWKKEKKSITYTYQQNALPRLKEKDPSLNLVHSQVLQDCLRRVDNAFQKFFRKEAKYPKKKKLSGYRSFTFPQVWMKQKGKLVEVVKLERQNSRFAYLYLPKLGKLKIRLHREIDWEKARTVTVKREPSGKWYVCITVEVELGQILREAEEKAVGIDLGVKNLATTSEGEFIEHPRFLQRLEKRLKREQKKLSRKEKGLNSWEKQRRKVAKVHEEFPRLWLRDSMSVPSVER
ncbi:putative transposase [Hydrogenivirga caldilitoris]|uniref:Putative transposase n=1 Tax=Hydrogenivirga caldilitoris TaxID=246264 RepID=A0A497XT71_9AQUI|nr:transposase [Hydrogenivirga caldilitoris]RLJ70332.1 putative transposase [Hydrogenivirga caldilitoris]